MSPAKIISVASAESTMNPQQPSPAVHSRLGWTPVAFSCLLIAVGQSGVGLILPALPVMGESLAVSGQEVQWLLSAFLLGFGPSQLLYGPLSDRYGRRPVLLSGLLLALAGVLICLIGHDSLAAILTGRLLQGIGAGGASVIARVSLRDQFEGARLRQVMSHFGTMMALFPTLAPLAGGLLTERCGWLSLFIAMAGYLVLLVLLIGWRFAETHTAVAQGPSPRDILRQYRQLLANSHFCCYSGIVWIQYGVGILSLSLIPFIMQRQLGVDSETYGYWTLLPAAALMLGGTLANRLRQQLSQEQVLWQAALLQGLAGVAMCALPATPWSVMASQALFTFATGMAFPNALSCLLEPFRRKAGTATALAGAGQMLTASLGSALLLHAGINTLPELGCILFIGALLLALLVQLGHHAIPASDEWTRRQQA